ARGRDAVLHQLHDGTAGVLDDTRHGDHGAARQGVPVPGGADRPTRLAASRRRRRRWCAVVPLHARLSRRSPHRRGAGHGRHPARARRAGRLARRLDPGVPPRVEPRHSQVRSGGRMKRMFRLPTSAFRLLAAFWRLNLVEELQYRANFIASLLGTVFDMATALLTLALFFHHTTALGGWDYWEIVVLLGVFNALTGVIEAVLRPGIGQLAREVRSGELDCVLVKPVDAQGFVSFRRLDIWRLTDVVLGLALAG